MWHVEEMLYEEIYVLTYGNGRSTLDKFVLVHYNHYGQAKEGMYNTDGAK